VVGEQVNLIILIVVHPDVCCFLFARCDENGGNATAMLQEAMTSCSGKTYLTLLRGECILQGRDEGWLKVNQPLKDE
jgi:hypothetical protein